MVFIKLKKKSMEIISSEKNLYFAAEPANVTCRVAALTILNMMGQIMKNKGKT